MTKVIKQDFQAEVHSLLNIVIHSLYTDSEIFIRELVSNASDSLEKLRVKQLADNEIYDSESPLEIHIATDEENKTITIQDFGVGLLQEELVENLGTIAHSGTKAFLENLQKDPKANAAEMIGQFGVGFYSAFMVASKVDIYTHSWDSKGENLRWSSDGATNYEISVLEEEQKRGAKIVIHLKEGQEEFAKKERVEAILKKYSNFINFPVLLNDEKVNTVEAIWLKSKAEVSAEQYEEFYKFIGNAWDKPRYTMHFSADAPISINALLFVPQENSEQFGMAMMQSGVSLYCKKVLIDDKPEKLLPEWLRFLKGVIDSADIPLNISRETMQDSTLMHKLKTVITKRFLKFLAKEAKGDEKKYQEFYGSFQRFLKEGAATDMEYQKPILELLRFESSMTKAGELTSFAEYQARMKEEQKGVYYLVGKSRQQIEASPYIEVFNEQKIEVIYFTDPVDQYLVDSVQQVAEKSLLSIDKADTDLEANKQDLTDAIDEKEQTVFLEWLNKHFADNAEKFVWKNQLVKSPVAAYLPENAPNAQMRAMMKAMGNDAPEAKAVIAFSSSHQLVKNIVELKDTQEAKAKMIVSQLIDGALLSAGLVENPQHLLQRMENILEEFSEKA